MLNLDNVQSIAQSYTPQELFAALVWQRRFNEFDGQEIITDLAAHPHLWRSFLFTKPIYAPDESGLSFCGVVETLLAMANYRPMPETSMVQFIPYPADTLYVLSENQDLIVSQLMDLGKKWRADSVDVSDGSSEEEDWEFQSYVALRLRRGLRSKNLKRDAVILSFWWD